MNKVILMGRLTRDPEMRYYVKDGNQNADFPECVVIEKIAI